MASHAYLGGSASEDPTLYSTAAGRIFKALATKAVLSATRAGELARMLYIPVDLRRSNPAEALANMR